MTWRDEQDLIASLFAPLASNLPGAFGLQDDAACLSPEPGHAFVLSTDAVVAGLHLPADADPLDVAWKALAVNVSDVVAKGARPLAYLCGVMVGQATDPEWLARFATGLDLAQHHFAVELAGGDTDRAKGIAAPAYHVAITMIATLPTGTFVSRSGARPGDDLVVTGPVGAATLGLRLDIGDAEAAAWGLDASAKAELLDAYRRPRPVVGLAEPLRVYANAAIDISDGLVKDIARMCMTSGVGARIDANAVSLPLAASGLLAAGKIEHELLLSGGEDYCVAAAVAADRTPAFMEAATRAGAAPVVIGRMTEPLEGVRVMDAGGRELTFARRGYDHIAD